MINMSATFSEQILSAGADQKADLANASGKWIYCRALPECRSVGLTPLVPSGHKKG